MVPAAVAAAGGFGALGIALIIVLIVLSLGVHEAAHAWSAWKLGDSTGKDMGRMTLNPIPHIDPFLTIGLPLLCILTSMPVFGGAKPVPVNFHRLRNPWVDMALVSFAGPFSNFLLAILFYALAELFVKTGYYNGAAEFPADRWSDLLPSVLFYVSLSNVALFVFNLIPIPPLDGSKVVAQALPESLRESYLRISFVGLLILYALLTLVPAFREFLTHTQIQVFRAVEAIVTLGGRW